MTLNEIEGMRVVMPRISRDWVDQILIVDGGSNDGTIAWAQEHGYDLYVQKKKGFRSAYQEVWPMVRGEVVIYFTPDGNSIPEVIPQLVSKMEEGFDLVIASRYLGNAKSLDDDPVTRFGNWLYRTLCNLLLRPAGAPRMTDPMVMLRAHRKDLPHRLGLDRPEPFESLERLFFTRVDWIPLMSMRTLARGLRWHEIPADEPARIGGERKLKCDPEHPGGVHIHPSESPAVRELYQHYAGGRVTLATLASSLNDQAFRTRNTKKLPDGNGNLIAGPRMFTSASIRHILHNPFYMGRIRHRGQVLPAAHDGLVPEDVYQTVQGAMRRNSGRSQTLQQRPQREYLLKGLIRCAHCRMPMWAQTFKNGRRVLPRAEGLARSRLLRRSVRVHVL